MKLKHYHQKREFMHTPEPKGKGRGDKPSSHLFVIQKHAAKHLHYDLRLEVDGVLKSWAVPKGPSLDPGVKRLAVLVEDHPIEYADFEGVIPKGQYGGGVVLVWDKGTWQETNESKQKHKKSADISFTLKGKKLKGKWKLIQIKNDPKNWLLIKSQDNEAKSKDEFDILEAMPLSVLTERTIDEIATDNLALASTNLGDFKNIIKKNKMKKSNLPSMISPQLATLVENPPLGNQWLHEMKFDGYRLLTVIEKKVKLLTRQHQDWTHRFKDIASSIAKIGLVNTILDGEIVALDKNGRPNFQNLQNALRLEAGAHLVYYVFDIIFYQGYNLSKLDLIERKMLLKEIIPSQDNMLRYSTYIQGEGQSVYKNACKLGFEGIVSKNINSQYVQKRTKTWLKTKCTKKQEFIIIGVTKPRGAREGFGALLLGHLSKDKTLTYCGRVGTGFSQQQLSEIYQSLSYLQKKQCPLSHQIRPRDLLFWVKPEMMVEVEFIEWTDDGLLRHPSFKRLIGERIKKQILIPTLNYHLSNPDRIVYPINEITKAQVANYYSLIHPWILPHIVNRAMAIVRCPKGINDACFFQKHMTKSKAYAHVYSKEHYIYIQNAQGLMELVQMGVLELHLWGVHVDNIAKPDMITFDLDPAPDVAWKKVIETAFLLKEALEYLDLQSFVKLTGGKGLHVVLPIRRLYTWDRVAYFAKNIAHYFSERYPRDYTDLSSKAKRKGKIFIDYLRNTSGASSIAPYSTRARINATIALPLAWDDLSVKIKPSHFTIDTMEKKIQSLSDPWVDPWDNFFDLKQKLPKYYDKK